MIQRNISAPVLRCVLNTILWRRNCFYAKDQQKLIELIKGKKVAFIGAGVSHKTLIKEFVELGAHVTLCDQKKSVEDFGDYAATIKELGIDLSLGENYLDGFKGQDIIMRTPGLCGLL